MEKKSPATYIGIGITIGVLLTVILISVLGIRPESISIGLVDFSLPASNESVDSNSIPPDSSFTNASTPKCRTGNNTGIAGQVLTVYGLPVTNAVITSNPPTESVTTDENGYYLICNIPAESTGRQYTIIVQKSEFTEAQIIVNAMPDNTAIGNVVLKVSP